MEERLYDLIFIARPATPEEDIKKVLTTIEHACAEKNAKIEKTENWGTRKLAYKVMKHREGMYTYMQIRTASPDLVHELERRLGVLDTVIKYQTVRVALPRRPRNKLPRLADRRFAEFPAYLRHSRPLRGFQSELSRSVA